MRSKKGAKGWMMIKVDLEKAYNRISWDFLRDTLQDVGFPPNIINLVMWTLDLGKYLGIPIQQRRIGKATFSHILDRVHSRINAWNHTSLSLAGRITLSKVVLLAIPAYVMQVSVVPLGVFDEIEKQIRSFVWGSTRSTKRPHLVAWDQLCMNKDQGGLGLRKMKDFNRAFIMKVGYGILSNPDALWAKVLRSKYKDIAGTLATEEAEDSAQVGKLRSALESVDLKRRKILQQMRSDVALLLENGGSPIQSPSSAAEDARLASLISLDGILKQIKDITRLSTMNTIGKSKKRTVLVSLDELTERMPSLLEIDHPCAQRHIADACRMVESIPEEDDRIQDLSHARKPSTDVGSGSGTDVAQWNVLQFNTGNTSPFIIKCGANSNSELIIKAEARVQEPNGGEIVRVAPRPSILENMSLEEMKQVFAELPDALSLLALARTADGTRARYSRLYRTLAMKVPSLRDLVIELEKGGSLKDVRT
ncbi:kinesin-like protein KIN-14B [Gastrolobium bilobum]|uniref:kinesin-like protein KIN-14B n=1 Tax=Gastrolobium bilobum TaxID=150636 RepID=UPI002AB08524|nr:kinesin-like protein KIN-14B [Gastrolobium bilobum]